MHNRIKKNLNYFNNIMAKQKSQENKQQYFANKYIVHKKVESNLKELKNILGKSNDIVYREFTIGVNEQIKGFLVYIDELVNKMQLSEGIEKVLSVNIYAERHNKELLT